MQTSEITIFYKFVIFLSPIHDQAMLLSCKQMTQESFVRAEDSYRGARSMKLEVFVLRMVLNQTR